MKNILITGGTGFIGSHTCLSLLEKGYKLTLIDSNINSSSKSFEKIKEILKNKRIKKYSLSFEKGDIRDKAFLKKVFLNAEKDKIPINAVIHFAGLKAVEESILKPKLYWENNVNGSICLFDVMKSFDCKTIVFSSSATVYCENSARFLSESAEIKPITPYGETKFAVENILKDIFKSSESSWKIANLRYFNPIGAHETGLIGECPLNMPNNLFPIICRVAQGKLHNLKIYGKDWPTTDGTGVRDYIHVMDLADAHCSALDFLLSNKPQVLDLNIGTGIGTSVLELVEKFMKVNKCLISYEFSNKRCGDLPFVVANNKKALSILNWKPRRNLEDMCRDGWKWQMLNPNGFF